MAIFIYFLGVRGVGPNYFFSYPPSEGGGGGAPFFRGHCSPFVVAI